MLGRRLEPAYRPWVSQQVQRPGYARRRTAATALIQICLVTVPQVLFGQHGGSRFQVVFFGALTLFWLGYPVLRKPFAPAVVARLLAYHGVDANGAVREVVLLHRANPLGWTGLALLMAQVLLVSAGGAVVYDRLQARRQCHSASVRALARIDAVVGRASVVKGFGPAPITAVGARLVRAKQVDQGLHGITYLAAYVHEDGRPEVGPGVWRVIAPGGDLPVPDIQLSAVNEAARGITPSLGYATNTPSDPALDKALDCLR